MAASQTVTFQIRTDFLYIEQRLDGSELVDQWSGGGPLAFASAKVQGQSGIRRANTDNRGRAVIQTEGLADGDFEVEITAERSSPRNRRIETSEDPITKLPSDPDDSPERIYRPLRFHISLTRGRFSAAQIDSRVTDGRIGHRRIREWQPDQEVAHQRLLPIDYRPVWIRRPNARKREGNLDTIVLHSPSSPLRFGPGIQHHLQSVVGSHYWVALDGHIVKIIHDSKRGSHVGSKNRWKRIRGWNQRTIGIEIVRAEEGGQYAGAQYTALRGLLAELTNNFGISRHRIIGHVDMATQGNSNVLGRKSDPHIEFDWDLLHGFGFGMGLGSAPDDQTMYGGFFSIRPAETLPKTTIAAQALGLVEDKHRKIVQELQLDLETIGYSINGINGRLDRSTQMAIRAFQLHFFSRGSENHRLPLTENGKPPSGGIDFGEVDLETARRLKQVRNDLA